MKSLIQYITEVSVRALQDDDWTWVNSEEGGRDLYAVRIWWGSGYALDAYCAYADDEETALEYTVAWLEKNEPKLLEKIDNWAEEDSEEEREQSYIYIDPTMAGGETPHWILLENLRVEKFPKNKIPKR